MILVLLKTELNAHQFLNAQNIYLDVIDFNVVTLCVCSVSQANMDSLGESLPRGCLAAVLFGQEGDVLLLHRDLLQSLNQLHLGPGYESYIHTYIHTYIHMYACMYIHICIHTHTYVYIRMYV